MTLKNQTYENLKHRIITHEFQAGQQLFEKELMQEYEIGRTPLREIFQELQRNGLIEIIPKLGTRVASIDIRVLREAVQIRRVLEGLAAQLAALHILPDQVARLHQLLEEAAQVTGSDQNSLIELTNIDLAFHQVIYEASGNKQLWEMVAALLYKMSMYWYQVGFSAREYREQFDELKELLQAIEKRKPDAAKEIIERHVDHFVELVKNKIF